MPKKSDNKNICLGTTVLIVVVLFILCAFMLPKYFSPCCAFSLNLGIVKNCEGGCAVFDYLIKWLIPDVCKETPIATPTPTPTITPRPTRTPIITPTPTPTPKLCRSYTGDYSVTDCGTLCGSKPCDEGNCVLVDFIPNLNGTNTCVCDCSESNCRTYIGEFSQMDCANWCPMKTCEGAGEICHVLSYTEIIAGFVSKCSCGCIEIPDYDCTDTDGGSVLGIFGTCSDTFSGGHPDSCEGQNIVEWFCSGSPEQCAAWHTTCPWGQTCLQGQCV